MPVGPISRYRTSPVGPAPDARGVLHPTVAMRLTPPTLDELSFTHTVVAGDTYESLAFRYYGASELWWRIADANVRDYPLAPETGSTLAIPSAADAGRVTRPRRF